MIGKEDSAFHAFAEVRHVSEFALGGAGFDLLAAELVFENFLAVEPMFDGLSMNIYA